MRPLKLAYTKHFIDEVVRRETPIDTTTIQLASLKLFMNELGYIQANKCLYGSRGWVARKGVVPYKDHKYISFNDSVVMHNISNDVYICCNEGIKLAGKACLVYSVKLQRVKGGGIIVQNHYISLVKDVDFLV